MPSELPSIFVIEQPLTESWLKAWLHVLINEDPFPTVIASTINQKWKIGWGQIFVLLLKLCHGDLHSYIF